MTSSIVNHNYHQFQIPQRRDGYVSLTKMAKAEGKYVAHFLANGQTKAYLEALATSIGIPIDQLIEIQKTGLNEERGTWAHPFIAVKFAAWLSPEFEVWATETLFNVIDERSALPGVAQTITPEIQETEAVVSLINLAMQGAQLGQTEAHTANLMAGLRLSIVGDRLPQLKESTMAAHKLLAATTPAPMLLTPTTIGVEFGMSARAVNNLLIRVGLQLRVPKEHRTKGEPDYRATEKGEQYAANTLSTGNMGDRSSYQHIKWAESVIPVLANFLQSETVEA